jgi:gas vesicle protein
MADRDDEYVRVDERVVIEVETGRDPQDPATIRTDIHETRERMSHTIEELSERLNPDHLKAQVKENVREATIGRAEHMAQKAVSRVSETRHSMMDTLRDNPVPAALMGIGLGWMLWNGRKQEERFEGDVAYQTYGRYPQTGYRYGSAGYGTTGGYAGGYGATGAYGGSGGYRYEEDEPGVAERARHRASELGDTARDKAGDLRDRAGDVAESARDTVSDLADRTRDAAGDAAERARMAAESLARQTRYRTHRLEDRFQDTLYETPLVLGAAAAVLGMAVGLSAPATRREVELMGATRDQLFDRAKEAASEAGEKVQAVAERVVDEAQSTAKQAAREQGLTGGGATGAGAGGSTGAGFGAGTGTGMGTGTGTGTGGFGGTGTGTGAGGMGTGTGTGTGGLGTGLGTGGTGTGTGTGGFGTGGAGSTGTGGGGFGAGGPGSTGTGGTGGTGTGSI